MYFVLDISYFSYFHVCIFNKNYAVLKNQKTMPQIKGKQQGVPNWHPLKANRVNRHLDYKCLKIKSRVIFHN